MAGRPKVVEVSVQGGDVSRKLALKPAGTAAELVAMFLQKSQSSGVSIEQFEGFGLCLPDRPDLRLHDDFVVYDMSQTKFLFKRFFLTMAVVLGFEEPFEEQPVKLCTSMTIDEVIQDICSKRWRTKLPSKSELALYMPPKGANIHKNRGVCMELERTLASYRPKPDDKLLLCAASKQENVWGERDTQQIPIIVRHEDLNMQKTLKFERIGTVEELIEDFFLKCKSAGADPGNPRKYNLFIESGNGNLEPMDRASELGSYSLATPARLLCRKPPPSLVFGVDPATLDMVEDNGLLVPEILVQLRQMLYDCNGLQQEGIFRHSGTESELIPIRDRLNRGEIVTLTNPHNIATLLKRFYKEVPKRLLHGLDPSLDEDDRVLEIPQHLSEVDAQLYYWLMDLLLETASYSEQNLMDAKNIAIVWGPGLVGSTEDDGNPFLGLSLTKFGINVVCKTLNALIENPPPPRPPLAKPRTRLQAYREELARQPPPQVVSRPGLGLGPSRPARTESPKAAHSSSAPASTATSWQAAPTQRKAPKLLIGQQEILSGARRATGDAPSSQQRGKAVPRPPPRRQTSALDATVPDAGNYQEQASEYQQPAGFYEEAVATSASSSGGEYLAEEEQQQQQQYEVDGSNGVGLEMSEEEAEYQRQLREYEEYLEKQRLYEEYLEKQRLYEEYLQKQKEYEEAIATQQAQQQDETSDDGGGGGDSSTPARRGGPARGGGGARAGASTRARGRGRGLPAGAGRRGLPDTPAG